MRLYALIGILNMQRIFQLNFCILLVIFSCSFSECKKLYIIVNRENIFYKMTIFNKKF